MRPGLKDALPCMSVRGCLTSSFSLQIPFLSAHDVSITLHGNENFSAELKNKDTPLKIHFFQRTVMAFFFFPLNTAGFEPLNTNLIAPTVLCIVCVINLCRRKNIIKEQFFLSDIIEQWIASVSATYLNL